MLHKINPIKFENSEGNTGVGNALFKFFSDGLPDYRLQRHLSDSTIERNLGVAFAHSLIAYEYTLKGLDKIGINENKVINELKKHPEIISEAYQTILKREGIEYPYEKLKELTKSKKVTLNDLRNFVDKLESLYPEFYIQNE